MDKRDFLRAHGFTVGSRGRFSKEMLEVLKDYVEPENTIVEDSIVVSTPATPQYPDLVKNVPVQREARILKGYTPEGYILNFVSCSECAEHMVYCSCAGGVRAPSSVIRSADPLVRVAAV